MKTFKDKLKQSLNKKMFIPFMKQEITIDYDEKSYAPTSHTTILQINNFSLQKGDSLAAVIGTGSGLDAIALAKKGIKKIIATDIDPYTLEIAGHNAEINNVSSQIEFKLGDMLEPLEKYKKQGLFFDIIFSSPPIMPVPPEKAKNIPEYLNGGPEGTKFLERTLQETCNYLKKDTGRLYINFGSTSNPKKLFALLSKQYKWKELARISLPFSEQFLQIWSYFIELQKQGKAEFWEENGVPFRWYAQIEARTK